MTEVSEEYIYKLTDPFTDEIRWIGRTTDPQARFFQHLSPLRSKAMSEKDTWIVGLQARGARPIMEIIEAVSDGHPVEREKYWIQWHFNQGHPLFNRTHMKKPVIIGYNQEQQKLRGHVAWLRRLLSRLPKELTPIDKLVYFSLLTMSNGEEKPMDVHLTHLAKSIKVTSYATLVIPGGGRESCLDRLHRLGLITYEHRLYDHAARITVHTNRINGEVKS